MLALADGGDGLLDSAAAGLWAGANLMLAGRIVTASRVEGPLGEKVTRAVAYGGADGSRNRNSRRPPGLLRLLWGAGGLAARWTSPPPRGSGQLMASAAAALKARAGA